MIQKTFICICVIILAVNLSGCATLLEPPGDEVERAQDALRSHEEREESMDVDIPRAAWLIYYWSQMQGGGDDGTD